MHRDSRDTHIVTSAMDAKRDFATIGDEDFLEQDR
jgi:hypothetical protein